MSELQDILAKADGSGSVYSNHVQITITARELIMDFYLLEPVPGQEDPSSTRVQRVFIPLVQAKGLASAIANIIPKYEQAMGIALPNLRNPDEEDVLDLWK